METIYQVPMLLQEQGLLQLLHRGIELDKVVMDSGLVAKGDTLWQLWKKTVTVSKEAAPVEIALVGKYTNFMDSYLSVQKALEHASMYCGRKLNLVPVDSEHLEEKAKAAEPEKYEAAWASVKKAQGIIIPGGFGSRGTEGMVICARWARENKKPFLGICLGMQVATIEVARTLCGMLDATSEEFDENSKSTQPNHAIVFMPEGSKEQLGGTMRLGSRATLFQSGSEWSKLRALYGGAAEVHERHRHRYEVNPDLIGRFEEAGMSFIGKDETGQRMEAFELRDHPYYVGYV